jgi:molybdopterin-guanine dinucleotide biosynthesis protein A
MDPGLTEIAAFILAGGKSTRMGADKAFIALDSRTLLARALDLARSVTADVWIVGDPAKFAPFGPVVRDVFEECGPLAGIHAALQASRANLNVILAIDVPFASLALFQYLITRAMDSADTTVTIPRVEGRLQPLCGIYRREFANFAESALKQGSCKIDAVFAKVSMRIIEEEELRNVGFSSRIFRNLNTREDLADACGEFQMGK